MSQNFSGVLFQSGGTSTVNIPDCADVNFGVLEQRGGTSTVNRYGDKGMLVTSTTAMKNSAESSGLPTTTFNIGQLNGMVHNDGNLKMDLHEDEVFVNGKRLSAENTRVERNVIVSRADAAKGCVTNMRIIAAHCLKEDE